LKGLGGLKILVAGAGALGCLYAGLLASQGHHLYLLGRKPLVEAVEKNGLKIRGLISLDVKVEAAVENPAQLKEEAFNLILLTVKAYQAAEAASSLTSLPAGKIPLVCLQNGLGVEEEVKKAVGNRFTVLRGVSFMGAYVEKPGLVRCTGLSSTLLEEPPPEVLSPLTEMLGSLKAYGLEADFKPQIREVVWEKTLVNAGINPFGAITGLKNGQLLEVPQLREAIAETVEEGWKVASKLGIAFSRNPVKLTFKVAEATAENYNSMLQDLKAGRRTEIDYINGAIARFGEETGVATPLNRLLTSLIKGLEAERKLVEI